MQKKRCHLFVVLVFNKVLLFRVVLSGLLVITGVVKELGLLWLNSSYRLINWILLIVVGSSGSIMETLLFRTPPISMTLNKNLWPFLPAFLLVKISPREYSNGKPFYFQRIDSLFNYIILE